ncbi:MAG: S-layer homology domain-containing protein [Peptoniphilus harei]|nr:S-layer homology domain-containing protein [Peptoniphilus harei]
MRNKKVLGLLLAGVMITAIPFNVFADEKDEVKTENPAAVETVENKDEVKVEETETEEVKEETSEEVVEEGKLEASEEKVPEAVTEVPEKPEEETTDSEEVTHKVTFDYNYGKTPTTQDVKENGKVTKIEATRYGYTFKGWYTDEECTSIFDFDTETIKGDITLYAKWEKVVPVTKVLSISERYYDNGRFYGKVTSDGIAVEGARVRLYDYDGDYLGQADKTDENGYFDINLGDYYGYYYYDDYYDGYYHYDSLRDKYYYFDSYGDRQYINYTPYNYRYWNGRYYKGKYDGGYLVATKDDFENSSKYSLYDGRYWKGYYGRYYYDDYHYGKYDKKVYPSDISRTNYSTSGYLKGYSNETVYVYDNGTYLGSDVINSNGYFSVTWNNPYVSTSRTLDYYVNGTYKSDNGYSMIPTVNEVAPGAKYVSGHAGDNADVTVYDAKGIKLGSAVATNNGVYNVSLNRAIKAGEKITVEAKEKGKISRTTDYTVAGEVVSSERVSQPKYISGFPDGTFKPGKEVSRAEAVRMFVKLVNNGAELPKNPTTKFKDANNSWYSDEINFAANKGFIKGYADGTFKPNQAITRAEFAQMIAVFVKDGYPGTGELKDVKGHWASDAINELYGNKNIKGYDDGTFKPDQKLTRAEAVTILNSVFGRNTKAASFENLNVSGLNEFSDVAKSHWAYYEILDASNAHVAVKSESSDGLSIWQ